MMTAVKVNRSIEEPAILEAAGAFLQTSNGIRQVIVEPSAKALMWGELIFSSFSQIIEGPKKIFEWASHSLLWVELPTQIMKLGKSLVKLKDMLISGSVLQASQQAVKTSVKAIFIGGLFADGVQILSQEKVISLSAAALSTVQAFVFLGSAAILVDGLMGIKKNIYKMIHTKRGSPEYNLALIQLISRVCIVVAAIFSMVATFHPLVVFSWIILCFSTLVLLCTLSSNFYELLFVSEK